MGGEYREPKRGAMWQKAEDTGLWLLQDMKGATA